MKLTISTFLSIFFSVFIAIIGTGFVNIHLETVNAREYNAAVIDRIESSNFATSYIDEIILESEKVGYPTTIEDVTIYDGKRDSLVTTKYTVDFPFFGIHKDGVVKGYAR